MCEPPYGAVRPNAPTVRRGEVRAEDANPTTDEEKSFAAKRAAIAEQESAYFHEQATRPQTLGVSMADSPVGAAGWIFVSEAQRLTLTAQGFDALCRHGPIYGHTATLNRFPKPDTRSAEHWPGLNGACPAVQTTKSGEKLLFRLEFVCSLACLSARQFEQVETSQLGIRAAGGSLADHSYDGC